MADYSFEDFKRIIERLRAKDGCPWDREQTHESLRQAMLEECYEAIDALDRKDIPNLREELGDILLQVVMHSVIAEILAHGTAGIRRQELHGSRIRRCSGNNNRIIQCAMIF